jgi:aspartyl-tRNA(Asn)/glutamyl-tRNA(Gln) amidotransferase subunit B
LGQVPKQTRGWDDQANVTRGQRHKEESSDYRYFPDPDLLPVVVSDAELESVRASLGELPAALRARLEQTYGIKPYDSDVLVNQGRALVDYYTELATQVDDGKLASNWIQQDVLRELNDRQWTIDQFPVRPAGFADLLKRVKAGQIDTSRAREVLLDMINTGRSAAEIIQERGIKQVDESELLALCRELLAKNPRIVTDIKEGRTKAAGALIGQAKKINPNVNPGRLLEICLELAAAM